MTTKRIEAFSADGARLKRKHTPLILLAAFSSEVGTGSHEEEKRGEGGKRLWSGEKKKLRAPFRFFIGTEKRKKKKRL